MVNYFSALVDFKNKSVIDLVLPKYLDIDSGGHYDENNHESEDVSFNTWRKFLPLILLSAELR